MATYIPPRYGIVLYYPRYTNPVVTLSGSVTNIGTAYNGDAVYGTNLTVPSFTAWTLTNTGTITGNLTSGSGVVLATGGTVSNAVRVGVSANYPGIITGYASGVYIKGGAGTVSNLGTIQGTGTASDGVLLSAGGTVTNSGTIEGTSNGVALSAGGYVSNASGGLISGYHGVYITGSAGTVSNLGTITSAAGNAVLLAMGGSVGNSGVISATGYGVFLGGAVGTVVNSGTITSVTDGHWGVALTAGGSVTNQSTGYIYGGVSVNGGTVRTVVNHGTIAGANLDGVHIAAGYVDNSGTISGAVGVNNYSGAGTVINTGTVKGTGTAGAGIDLAAGGSVNNTATSALIAGYVHGIYIGGSGGTVANLGTIQGTSYAAISITAGLVSNSGTISALGTAHAGVAVQNAIGTVVNLGVIQGSGAGAGIHLHAGGSVSNGSVSVTTASITGGYNGVRVTGGSGTVNNYATIAATGTSGVAVYLKAGGTVTNTAQISGGFAGVKLQTGGVVFNGLTGGSTATISGAKYGVWAETAAASVSNYGTINGTGTAGDGVFLNAGGAVVNQALGLITGVSDGVCIAGSAGTVVNSGSITGTGTGALGAMFSAGGSLTNTSAGVIGGAAAGVSFTLVAGTVANYGAISGTAGEGIYLGQGGTVTNGTGSSTAAITGLSEGIRIEHASGAVNNYGVIAATATTGSPAAVDLLAGGSVVNRSSASISGLGFGVSITYALGTVTNYGAIGASGAYGAGVYLGAGGMVTNYGTIASNDGIRLAQGGTAVNKAGALLSGANDAIAIGGTAGAGSAANYGTIVSSHDGIVLGAVGNTVTNSGIITASTHFGIYLTASGTVTNTASGQIDAYKGVVANAVATVTNLGLITGIGANGAGVELLVAGSTLTNAGTISAAGASGVGVLLAAGGSVSNASGGLIEGDYDAVRVAGSAGTVSNLGTILAIGTFTDGVAMFAGGSVTNGASGNATALIEGNGRRGVFIYGGTGTVTNFGTIQNLLTTYVAVYLKAGGSVTNNQGGLILGGAGFKDGIAIGNATGTVTNYGSINGIFIGAGGSVTNQSSGVIQGIGTGIWFNATSGTVINSGTIAGTGTGGVGVEFGLGGSTLTNAGTIIGDPSGAAVRFTSGSNRLIVDPGAVFSGNVYGGGGVGDVLELAAGTAGTAGTITGLGTAVTGFDNVTVDSLAAWLLAGPANLGSGTTLSNSGTLDIGGTVTVGGTLLDNGVIDIGPSATLAVANGASGVGSLVFAGTSGTLEIDGTTMPSTSVVISGFTPGETIHLRDIAGGNAGRPVPGASNLLTVSEGGTSFPLQFDPAQSFGGFAVVGDGVSGTDLLALPHLSVLAGNTTVSAGQAYISATVSGGTLKVASNGSVYGTQIGSAGSETISSGGFDSGTVIVGGGRQTVLAGGVASGTVLDAAAVQDVFGSANGAVVSAGDTQRVESGGVATSTTVSSGGSEVVSAGGTAIGSLVLSGGTETVSAGGTDSGASLSGGLQDLFGTASGDTVFNGGRQLVESGGVASNTVVSGGGTIELAAGAMESGAITFSGIGGDLKIDGGAAMPSVPISGFVLGDTIDLQGLAFTPAISASILSGTLSVTSGGTVVDQLAVAGISDGQPFVATSDGVGGTAIGRGASTTVAYMTGATDPWGVGAGNTGSPDAAMDTAFGAGNWTKIQGFTAAALTAGFKFIYLDGGDGDSAEFDSFIASNRTALQNFVTQGGRLFINAARWVNGTSGGAPATDTSFNLGFGVTLVGANYASTGTALQVTNPIFTGYNGPTGSSWTGNWFSHDFIVGSNGVSLTPLISGTNSAGSAGISLAGEHYGGGYVMFGGITSPSFQSPQPQADLLRANILDFAAGVGAVTAASLFDFVFTYAGGMDYYIGSVADNGTFKYTVGQTITTTAGTYDIFNKESGTTAQASGTVHVLDYSHSGPGVASPIPVLTAEGLADGTAGLGSESDSVFGTDGTQHAFSSTVEPSFPMAGLFGFVFTYADGAAFYSGTVVAAPGATPALPGSSLGTYTFFAEGVTAQLAGTVVVDRFTEGPASFVPDGAGGAAGTGGLGSEAGSVTVNGTTFYFSDNLEPVIPLGVVTVPVIPAPPTADIIATQLDQIFNEVLGRNPSSTESQNDSAAVAGGTSLSAIRTALAGSPEAQGDLTQLYSQIFARAATGGELATDTGQLAGGSSLQTVQLALAQSPEAQTDLQTIYSNVLNRAPNGNELATFIGQLGDEQLSAPADPNGRPGLAGVRDIVAHSPEAQADLSQLFQGVILRAPAAAELVGMEDQLANPGNTQATLTSALQGLGPAAAGYATITAPSGGATLTAQAGTPTLFDFTQLPFGVDTIAGFDPSRDTIELPVSLAANFAAVQADLSATTPATITLGATQSIQLSGVAPTSLGTANFLFK